MTQELQAEVVVPQTPPRRRKVIVPVGCGLVGIAAGAIATAVWMPAEVHTKTVVVEPRCEAAPIVVPPPVAPAPPPAVPASSDEVALVVSVGGDTYLELDTQGALPEHAAATLVSDSSPWMTAIAEVSAKHVPAYLHDWEQRTVRVDDACEARVTGFALIGRLTGNASDADPSLESWDADAVLDYGRPTLFARLDGCNGTFARDATRPAITVLADTSTQGDLAERALDRLATSKLVIDAQTAWREAGNDGNWYESSEAHVDTHVMRHPRTGELWVVVHAHRYGDCGDIGGNVVGLYRVDASGKLETVQEREGGFDRLEQVIDLEGDGELELVGSGTTYSSIERANGDSVRTLGVASYGCGC